MKKLFPLLIILLLSKAAFSQEDDKMFHPGLRFNPMITWYHAEAKENTVSINSDGMKFGYSYGVMGDFMFQDNYGLSLELRFAQIGGVTERSPSIFMPDGPAKVNYERTTFNVQYLQIPVSLKMKTNEVGYMKYYGQFGFIPSIKTKARASGTYGPDNSNTTEYKTINIGPYISPFNVYLLIGGGVEYNLGGSTSLLGGLSFENGFINVARDRSSAPNKTDLRSKVISINLGVLF